MSPARREQRPPFLNPCLGSLSPHPWAPHTPLDSLPSISEPGVFWPTKLGGLASCSANIGLPSWPPLPASPPRPKESPLLYHKVHESVSLRGHGVGLFPSGRVSYSLFYTRHHAQCLARREPSLNTSCRMNKTDPAPGVGASSPQQRQPRPALLQLTALCTLQTLEHLRSACRVTAFIIDYARNQH